MYPFAGDGNFHELMEYRMRVPFISSCSRSTSKSQSTVRQKVGFDSLEEIGHHLTNLGIICGGSTLSTSFEDLVKDRIRSAGIPEPLLSALCSKIVQQFEDNFKRTFDGTQHFSFNKDADEEFERIQFQFSISRYFSSIFLLNNADQKKATKCVN